MKCICCNKNKGIYRHNDGGRVCRDCLGFYFTCPDCGMIYNQGDFENGDAGTGFCRKCKLEHD